MLDSLNFAKSEFLLNSNVKPIRFSYVKNNFQKFFEAILVAAASAFIGFITLLLVDDCQTIGVNPHLTDVTKLWCDRGKYSAVANLFFQTPEESVKSLLHSPFNAFRPLTLLIFAVEIFFLTMWTYGLSIPGGIFIPLLLCGAAWGRLIGLGVETLFPAIVSIFLLYILNFKI
jgi:chloride channel 7